MIQDKVVVITGASSGIGHSTAKALAKKGAKIVAGARRLDRLESLKKEITDDGGEITICETDVTKKTDCDNLVKQALDKYGTCLLYTSPSPRDRTRSRMPSSA